MTEAIAVQQLGGGESEQARQALGRLRTEVAKVVVGQDAIVSGLVIALVIFRTRRPDPAGSVRRAPLVR